MCDQKRPKNIRKSHSTQSRAEHLKSQKKKNMNAAHLGTVSRTAEPLRNPNSINVLIKTASVANIGNVWPAEDDARQPAGVTRW
ncbi:hypothetical protein NDU88_003703 [Pleurodeles waltl]|uniref:Uncharacterized protein n=1 Tax=Pleurodeles waltl TaxID=8319 RepID=A0AAV7VHJ1_PLEWA|nr:hypothetical protein NDU88_003703 [Pleurodeles waltl]